MDDLNEMYEMAANAEDDYYGDDDMEIEDDFDVDAYFADYMKRNGIYDNYDEWSDHHYQ